MSANERYYIAWTSVDGAGQQNAADEPYLTLAEASTECERLQRVAERPMTVETLGGRVDTYVNPWGYAYRVVNHRYDTVYRAYATRAKQIA